MSVLKYKQPTPKDNILRLGNVDMLLDKELMLRLSSQNVPDWVTAAQQIEIGLRNELHGKGLIRDFKNIVQTEREEVFRDELKSVENQVNFATLDDDIEDYTATRMEHDRIFYEYPLTFSPVDTLYDVLHDHTYPLAWSVLNHIRDSSEATDLATRRLAAILATVVNASVKQASKKNAGVTGEILARIIFACAGLNEAKDFRAQFKGKTDAVADFVVPRVEHERDQDVEMYIAVQMSTNDRFRSAMSELRPGAESILITGNGLSASSKILKDIATTQLSQFAQQNGKLVCYAKELYAERNRVNTDMTDSDAKDVRRDFFENYTMTFSDFAKKLSSRRAT